MHERNAHRDRWICSIRGNGIKHAYPTEHVDLTRAVVGAAVQVRELELTCAW